jgi:acetylornithine deacetylase/succinyl-diaminopimelate desuccinylase-like protein
VQIRKIHSGDWWLGEPSGKLFQAAASAIHEVWGMEALFTREGGTIPLTSFLERTLNAPAIHIPIGQRSDAAHLENERIRIENLSKGKSVLKVLLEKLAAMSTTV